MVDVQSYLNFWSQFTGEQADASELRTLAEASRRIELSRGEVLISQDDQSNAVYLVVFGSLKAVRYSKNGHEIWLASYDPYALIGEMSGLTDAPRSSTVLCEESSLLLAVSGPEFQATMSKSPVFAWTVAKLLAVRLRTTSIQLEELATLQTSSRLHAELLRLGEFYPDDDEMALINDPPSVSELAVRIHAARESTSRALSNLLKRGFLQKNDDGSLKVIAPRGLA